MSYADGWAQTLGRSIIARMDEQIAEIESWWRERVPAGPTLAEILGERGLFLDRITRDSLARMERAAPGTPRAKRDLCALVFCIVTEGRDIALLPELIGRMRGYEFLQTPELYPDPSRRVEAVCEVHLLISKLRADDPVDLRPESTTTTVGREAAQALAAARHKDNRLDREYIQGWYRQNRGRFKSKDAAAEFAVTERLVAQRFRTIRDWLKRA